MAEALSNWSSRWNDGLAAGFDSQGLWNREGSVWNQLTTWYPSALATVNLE